MEIFFGIKDSDSANAESSNSEIIKRGILGDAIENYGKAAVMILANNGIQPKFSKYSGVCEWRNCVFLWVNIVKGKGINYGNTFNEKGRFITWFGGSKMTEGIIFFPVNTLLIYLLITTTTKIIFFLNITTADTDVVKRLLAVPSAQTLEELKVIGMEDYKREETGQTDNIITDRNKVLNKKDNDNDNYGDQNNYNNNSIDNKMDNNIDDRNSNRNDNSSNNIIDNNNNYNNNNNNNDDNIENNNDKESSSFGQSDQIILFVRIEGENYSCLGRVGYISYNLNTSPIEFEWELLDFDKIKNHETFKRILQT